MKDYINENLSTNERVISLLSEYGGIYGNHHKQWLLDQIARVVMNCPVETKTAESEGNTYSYKGLGVNEKYNEWAKGNEYRDDWDCGIAP